ncbi:MAG: hypothetical protein E7Z84_05280 [Methanosphaera stadtmanae]|nr:hypothetical protein [Methanosphaera stadtmanae]
MERIEKLFTNFANTQEDKLKEMNISKEEFIEQAKEWSKTEEGKLEIQKFILQREIDDLTDQISELEENISKKQIAIKDIDKELSKL